MAWMLLALSLVLLAFVWWLFYDIRKAGWDLVWEKHE